MSEMHQPFDQVLRIPVDTAFDLMAAHRKNNEPSQ